MSIARLSLMPLSIALATLKVRGGHVSDAEMAVLIRKSNEDEAAPERRRAAVSDSACNRR